jgi:hypothetical protein
VNWRMGLIVFMGLGGIMSVAVAQDAPAGGAGTNGPQPRQGRGWEGQEGGQRPIFGKITAVHDGGMEITRPDGTVVSVKLTAQTEFRKDRESAKATDFKVGDTVIVRGDESADHSLTAKTIAARTGGPGGGPGRGPGGGGSGGMMAGTLGKDYVAGEIKAIDAPRITVLRTDNVTQVLELNEESSLRRGRESITMADIQVGDHVMARGAVQNDIFVPKGVMVMNAEQWKRMQEFAAQTNSTKPAGSDAPAPKPQE